MGQKYIIFWKCQPVIPFKYIMDDISKHGKIYWYKKGLNCTLLLFTIVILNVSTSYFDKGPDKKKKLV